MSHIIFYTFRTIVAFASKHKVQASSLMLIIFNNSSFLCLGKITFSSSDKMACVLKDWNVIGFLVCVSWVGENRKGLDPKLNSHCWNDMKDAAAKNPLQFWGWKTLELKKKQIWNYTSMARNQKNRVEILYSWLEITYLNSLWSSFPFK